MICANYINYLNIFVNYFYCIYSVIYFFSFRDADRMREKQLEKLKKQEEK